MIVQHENTAVRQRQIIAAARRLIVRYGSEHVTVRRIAKEIGVTWNTAQIHLYKLLAEGKVRGKRVGRQNQWTVTDR